MKSLKKDKKNVEVAELSQLEAELRRVNRGSRFRSLLRSTVFTLLVVAASA